MNKFFKFAGVAATAVMLSACSQELSLGDPIDGIEPGTAEDFAARAGDKVYFDYDQYNVRADAEQTLTLQALWMNTYADTNVQVQGHCDERGTRVYNQGLGERRADAVKDFLVANGVDATRLSTISYGEERPEVDGHDEAAWAKNRRGVSVVK